MKVRETVLHWLTCYACSHEASKTARDQGPKGHAHDVLLPVGGYGGQCPYHDSQCRQIGKSTESVSGHDD